MQASPRRLRLETEPSFGAWVRRRRKALDLLQKELANRVGCSVPALQKIERDERRPSRHLAERLADALEVPVDQRAGFVHVARGERITERLEPIPQRAPAEVARERVLPRRLPSPATPLVGREAECARLKALLGDPACRFLTLTGPGGIGKTRLALAAAAQHNAADGTVFVALASLVDREQMVTAIADELGYAFYGNSDRASQLIHSVRDKAILFVLDNMDHLLAEPACVEFIRFLLQTSSKSKLLITSREPLDIQEEWVFDVQGLPIPMSARADEMKSSSAAQLFTQRARQAHASTTLRDRKSVV